jgi:hypothetical protein
MERAQIDSAVGVVGARGEKLVRTQQAADLLGADA